MSARLEIPVPTDGDRLLFLRFSSLGDLLLALRKAKALKTRFPCLYLTWLCQTEYEGLLRMQPYVDDVLSWDLNRGRLTVFSLIRRIRKMKFKFLYSVHPNDRSALISSLSGIPVKIGCHKNLQVCYGYSLKETAKAWGLSEPEDEEVILSVPDEHKRKILAKLPAATEQILFCAIGASKKFKRWPPRSWSAFLAEAVRIGMKPVLVGNGSEEKRMAEEVLSSCPREVLDFVGELSLEEVCALASVSQVAIGGDTGPTHLARMIGIPCLGLFAVRDPSRYGHRGENLFSFVSRDPFESYPEKAPDAIPLESIEPFEVAEELERILASLRKDSSRGSLGKKSPLSGGSGNNAAAMGLFEP